MSEEARQAPGQLDPENGLPHEGPTGGPGGLPLPRRRKITKDTPWRTPMSPIPPEQISRVYSADVVVVGHGYAGITACRELTEQGYRVVLLESQPEKTYRPVGNAMGAINASLMRERGIPYVDPLDFYNNWMLNCAYVCNQTLVMKYAQNSGKAMDWYLSECSKADLDTMTIQYWPRTETLRSRMADKVDDYHFWVGSISCYGDCGQTRIHRYNRELCRRLGAEFVFDAHACQLVMDGNGTAQGVIAEMADGSYIRAEGRAVVLATGGFGSNREMCAELLADFNAMRQTGDMPIFTGTDCDGSGIQMAVWQGAKLDPWPIPTMDGRLYNPSMPQALWLDKQGKRYCNEFVGALELRGRQALTMNRDKFYVLFDDSLTENVESTPASHGALDPEPETLARLRRELDRAAAHGDGEAEKDSMGHSVFRGRLSAADTLEELVAGLDCTEKVKANILASVARYNENCRAGRDEDFGRDPAFLFPLEKAPFYAEEVTNNRIGFFMGTLGGLVIDGEQRVLGENYDPIPGLFASGALTSGRFGLDYYTPVFGASIGINVTLGRECGRSVARYLRGELDVD